PRPCTQATLPARTAIGQICSTLDAAQRSTLDEESLRNKEQRQRRNDRYQRRGHEIVPVRIRERAEIQAEPHRQRVFLGRIEVDQWRQERVPVGEERKDRYGGERWFG